MTMNLIAPAVASIGTLFGCALPPTDLADELQLVYEVEGSHDAIDDAADLIERRLEAAGHEISVVGDCNGEPCDYPDNAFLVGSAVADGRADMGILVCGSGLGVSIAAGGVLSGEHGIGLEKRDLMPLLFSADDLDAQARLREAFGPGGE